MTEMNVRHNAKIIILVALVALLLTGCQAFGSKQAPSIPDPSAAFKGKNGLVISFFEGAPPEKLFPKSTTNVALLLENKGAMSISCVPNEDPLDQSYNPGGCGRFIVFSKEPLEFSNEDGLEKAVQNYDSKLIGKESYASGGRAAHTISNLPVGDAAKTTSAYVFAAACYPYETKLSMPVCVDVASFTVSKESKVCEMKDIRLTNQGAPVAITKVEQNKFVQVVDGRTVVKPLLRVFVQNVGSGIVIERSKQSFEKACTSEAISKGIDALILGKIIVKEAKISGQEAICNKGKPYTLSGRPEKDFIECVAEQGFSPDEYTSNFVATFSITLSYGYQSSASKNVLIEVLDEPPLITSFTLPKEITKDDIKNEKVAVGITATDDFGVKEIKLLDKDGKEMPSYIYDCYSNKLTEAIPECGNCDYQIECKAQFQMPATAPLERTYTFNAQAIDSAENPSRIRSASGVITGPPDVKFVDFPASASAGSALSLKVTATDDTSIKSIELLDGNGNSLKKQDCLAAINTCTYEFTKDAPAEAGKQYTYKAKATDRQGNEKETEASSGTTEAFSQKQPPAP